MSEFTASFNDDGDRARQVELFNHCYEGSRLKITNIGEFTFGKDFDMSVAKRFSKFEGTINHRINGLLFPASLVTPYCFGRNIRFGSDFTEEKLKDEVWRQDFETIFKWTDGEFDSPPSGFESSYSQKFKGVYRTFNDLLLLVLSLSHKMENFFFLPMESKNAVVVCGKKIGREHKGRGHQVQKDEVN